MRKMIIFVEDKVLKKVIQTFLKKHNKEFSVRIPTKGGGWNTVLESVRTLNNQNINAKGIIDGDISDDALKSAEKQGIKEKIFVTAEREIEKYFYNKEEIKQICAERIEIVNFDKFKKWLNEENQEEILNEVSNLLIKQDCEELKKLKEFLTGF